MIDALMPIISDSYLVIIPLLIVYLICSKKKNVYPILLAILLTFLVVTAMKMTIVTPRPCAGIVGVCEDPLDSFPSRHAAVVSAVLVFLWSKKPLFIAYSAYVLLIAFSRLYMGAHYLQDVLVGALIGICIGYVCLKFSGRLGLERRVV